MVWLAMLALPATATDLAGPGVVFEQAAFRQLEPAAPAPWQTVTLPDTWGARGLPLAGRAHYRLQLRLQQNQQRLSQLLLRRLFQLPLLLLPLQHSYLLQRCQPQPLPRHLMQFCLQ